MADSEIPARRLQVANARPDDAGRGLARLSPATMASLGLAEGDVVEIVGKRATIADFSLCGYLFYGDELPFDLNSFANVQNWLDQIRNLKGWKHPYDLMPRKP